MILTKSACDSSDTFHGCPSVSFNIGVFKIKVLFYMDVKITINISTRAFDPFDPFQISVIIKLG